MKFVLKQPLLVALALSLAAWAWRGIDYALIGSIGPLILALAAIALLWIGWIRGNRWWTRSVRIWGAILLLIGLARAVLAIGLVLDPGMSQHGAEALTLHYHAMTLFHLILGAWLIISPPAKPEAP
ncbi:MAG: hypothetical protein HKO13_00260 [Sphingomonas sp.]|nr:hypothetical protein [Sphingomonas sp.]RZV52426.1 MAG: hypothetical protein EX258_02115 [Sphingomonadaceae bacterium]